MGNQTQDSGRQDQQGNKPQAGSNDPNRQGGTQQPRKPGEGPEGNTVESATDDRGLGRGQRAENRSDKNDDKAEGGDADRGDRSEQSDRKPSGSPSR